MNRILGFTLIGLFFSLVSSGEESPSSTVDLDKKISELAQQVTTLDKKDQSLTFSGDFRYRHQSETAGAKPERRIHRFSLRLGFDKKFSDSLTLTTKVLTGSSASSGNQTMGDPSAPGFPRRLIDVDQAFVNYAPRENVKLYLGRSASAFYAAGKNQTLLDRDISPEGMSLLVKQGVNDSNTLLLNGASYWIREAYDDTNSQDLTDSFLNGAQVIFQNKNNMGLLSLGIGSYSFTAIRDNPPTFFTSGGKARGNTLDLSNNYPTNFDIQEYFVEFKHKVDQWDLGYYYLKLKNQDASTLNESDNYGFSVGYQEWSFNCTYKQVEKDAVMGLFTDSDFAGGETSSRGIVAGLSYKLSGYSTAALTYFDDETSIDQPTPSKYKRMHLDYSVSF